ncbi:transcriptional regulator [Caulobacter sp. 17J65-9]|uniref:transcriptional regulator n=1 Tax=Caulobacter sp. 17J65-9 TaxID=2709382 RepID=UPI0013C833B7|nr:transcriptional regulator [Caulobacter sp. 17J65-9]NEX93697.1 transcriptional regulator [Caulobacter sp. 17J65-9]
MIDNSYLLGLYGSTSTLSTSTGAASTPRKANPTPPWDPSTKAAPPSQLVQAALAGKKLIDLDAAKLDVPGASADYRQLFGLYQGLAALRGLAERMDGKGVSAAEQTRIAARFASGLDEVADFVENVRLKDLQMVRSSATDKLKSTGGVKRDTNDYVGPAVHKGAAGDAVAVFQGDVRFSIDVAKLGKTVRVDIDLADMGSTPRTMSAVVSHINAQLDAAGVQTRFAVERIAAQPRVIQLGSKTVTLPAEADSFAFKVKGTSLEKVKFSAPDTADAVYLAQTAGKAGATVQQVVKFQSDVVDTGAAPPPVVQAAGDTNWVDGRTYQKDLATGVDVVRATAAGPDGSMFVLADVDTAISGQAIKGERDVALMKYDSAGKLLWTRTLGAGETASGYALAVSADGKVAVAGSVTGELNRGDEGKDPAKSDNFVSVFDAEGDELWTQRRGARDEDQATAVAFGADGSVYVAGRAKSAMPGATGLGGYDGYLQGFSASGAAKFTTQFGSAGDDKVTAIAVDGDAVVVGGVESGHAVLRRLALQPSGAPTLESTRDLGNLSGGELTGLAIDGGRVIVAGSTRNASLDAGVVTRAHAGGSEVFVASFDEGLVADASDRLTWFGGEGDDSAAGLAVANGKVWLTGKAGTDLPGLPSVGAAGKDGYLVRLDPTTGAIEWSRRFSGKDGEAAPTAIAVGKGAASVLDRLGLPAGTLDGADSKKIVAATSARAGDRFMVRNWPSGRQTAVEIGANDTLADVARKIERASGYQAKVSVVKDGDFERLQILPRDDRSNVEVMGGEDGGRALAALGLSEGLVRQKSTDADAATVYGLRLPRDLSLDGKEAIKATLSKLDSALLTIRSAYRALAADGKPEAKPITGQAPAYLQAQLANYQAALSRLGGG